MSMLQADEVRRWAEEVKQAERAYWDVVARYVVLSPPSPGEPQKRPSRVFDAAAVAEFEALELNRRKATERFHSMLKRRARAMGE